MGVFQAKPENPASKVDWEALEGELIKCMKRPDHDDGTLGPIFLRLAWHSSGTYCAKSKTGGSANGATMRHLEGSEAKDPENAGLDKAIKFLEPVKKKFPDVSYADLWIFAAYVFLEASGGPKMTFIPGRVDKGPEHAMKPGRLPGAEHGVCPGMDKEGRVNGWQANAHHVRTVFYRMGLNDQEITALLCGGHVYGRCHTENSGYNGPWVVEPWRFSNEYAEDMLNDRWEVAAYKNMPEGKEDAEDVMPIQGKRQYVGFPADEEEDDDEVKADEGNADFPVGRYEVDTTWVNIREGPQVNSPIMGRPKTGEVFDIVATATDAGKSVRGRLAIGGWVSLRGSGGVSLFKRISDLKLPVGEFRITGAVAAVYYRNGDEFAENEKAEKPEENAVVTVSEIVAHGKEVYGKLANGNFLKLVAPGQTPFYDRIQQGWNEQPRSIRFQEIENQMMLVSDMVLLWDAGFKKYLEIYGAEDGGEDKLREDFGKAFKKLTELGFTQFPAATPLPECPAADKHANATEEQKSKCPVTGHA